MSSVHPTDPAESVKTPKPSKPCPNFPLFPHAAGVWAKEICGKMHYFGPWDDPDGALNKYLEQKDDLHAAPLASTRYTVLKCSQTSKILGYLRCVGPGAIPGKCNRHCALPFAPLTMFPHSTKTVGRTKRLEFDPAYSGTTGPPLRILMSVQ